MTCRRSSRVTKPAPSGRGDSPRESGESRLRSLLTRRSLKTGRFERLFPEDRQLYFAFIAKRN